MKKVAIVFLSLIVIVGCNQNAEKQGVSNTPPLFSISDNITIEPIPSTNNTVEIAMVTDKVKTGLDISNYIVNWNDYLKEKFDIDINFKYFGKLQYYDDNWYPTLLSTDIFTYNTGVVFSDNLVPYIKNKIIQPFTDYVVMSEYWSSFPGEFRNSYRDANGDIWAIPYSDHITVFSRAINTDWLNALNIEVPSSTDNYMSCCTVLHIMILMITGKMTLMV